MSYLRTTDKTAFAPRPAHDTASLKWPTDNHTLFDHPENFFAATRANSDYGKPGWTRDCGKRFHRGCDIAPVNKSSDGKTHTVQFSDCAKGTEYAAEEPGWIPHDQVYAVCAGVVVELGNEPLADTLGKYVIVEHRWEKQGYAFYSMYAHLDSIAVRIGQVLAGGDVIGTMGQTSSSADAREWMAIAPHLHLEFWNDAGESFDPVDILSHFLIRG